MTRYRYLNVEPNEEKLQDCVIRAISLACAVRYDDVVNHLDKNATASSCDSINVCCYTKLIEDWGYCTREVEGLDLNVSDIAMMHPDKVLLIRIDGHLTCVIDNCVYDIWDCRNRIATRYWIIY